MVAVCAMALWKRPLTCANRAHKGAHSDTRGTLGFIRSADPPAITLSVELASQLPDSVAAAEAPRCQVVAGNVLRCRSVDLSSVTRR